jgi:hypothetical protein
MFSFSILLVMLGLHESGPNQTAEELLGDLEPGSRLAFAAMRLRRDHDEAAKKYDEDFRTIEGRTGLEDFCFFRQSGKELVRMKRSTLHLGLSC